jgi:sugar transferase (PEP-CTERM system associated)
MNAVGFLRRHYSIKIAALTVGNCVLVVSAVLLAVALRFGGLAYLMENLWGFLAKALVLLGVFQVSLHYADFYDHKVAESPWQLVQGLLRALGLSCLLLSLMYYMLPQLMVGRGVVFIALSLTMFFVFAWNYLILQATRLKKWQQKVVIVGSGRVAKQTAQAILDQKGSPFEVLGFIDRDRSRIGERILNPGIIGAYDQLCQIVERERPVILVVALDDRRNSFPVDDLLNCKMKGVTIEDHTTFLKRLMGKLMIENLSPSHLIFSDGFRKSRFTLNAKRIIESVLSLTALIVLSPLFLIIAILIKVDSPGPVFLRQERVGENGRIFIIYKFRSMRNDAERFSGPVWAKQDDDRVTRLGKFLRKLRIDELPQFWNVLKADLSLVGPRPERPQFVKRLEQQIPYYALRHSVRPGITGWAQVSFSYGASVEDATEKLRYDLFYIENLSLLFDFMIILRTIKIVILGKGAR